MENFPNSKINSHFSNSPWVDKQSGSNQSGVRQYNERLIIQLIRRLGGLPKAEIARATNLSPQTASVIVNRLLKDGLLIKQKPTKGKVGQPSVPITLNPDGAYSIGVKIGRRSLDVILMGFTGDVLQHVVKKYEFPRPEEVFHGIDDGIKEIEKSLTAEQLERLVGIGFAAPYSLGGWEQEIGAPKEIIEKWKTIDIESEIKSRYGQNTTFFNDATAACVSELVFGKGLFYENVLYFFIGTFIGGGVVINGALHEGKFGNSGAIGSMPVCLPGEKKSSQLIASASLWCLENSLSKAGFDLESIQHAAHLPIEAEVIVDQWVERAASAIAFSIVASTSVIDFDGVIIDGALPAAVLGHLIERVEKAYADLNSEGLIKPEIIPGSIGANARALGGAILPLYSAFAPDREVLLKSQSL